MFCMVFLCPDGISPGFRGSSHLPESFTHGELNVFSFMIGGQTFGGHELLIPHSEPEELQVRWSSNYK